MLCINGNGGVLIVFWWCLEVWFVYVLWRFSFVSRDDEKLCREDPRNPLKGNAHLSWRTERESTKQTQEKCTFLEVLASVGRTNGPSQKMKKTQFSLQPTVKPWNLTLFIIALWNVGPTSQTNSWTNETSTVHSCSLECWSVRQSARRSDRRNRIILNWYIFYGKL